MWVWVCVSLCVGGCVVCVRAWEQRSGGSSQSLEVQAAPGPHDGDCDAKAGREDVPAGGAPPALQLPMRQAGEREGHGGGDEGP